MSPPAPHPARDPLPIAGLLCLGAVLLPSTGCGEPAPPLDGAFTVSGDGYLGRISARGGGCARAGLVGELHGPTLTTGGEVPVTWEEEEGGRLWLYLPVRTALGEGTAALGVQGREALLPLGARPGEFSHRLDWEVGVASDDALAGARTAAEAALDAAARAWADGAFRLEEPDGTVVGEVLLRGDVPPAVGVYDRTWWTDGLVPADRRDDGPEIVLTFTVEPTLREEEGLLRLNVPHATAVVPADRVPTEIDRHLIMVPGPVTPAERETARARARTQADQAELDLLTEVGTRLAGRARTADGRCLPWQEAVPELGPLVAGYDVGVAPDEAGDSCVVTFEPVVTQHRRRLQLQVGPDGVRGE